ncbi:MAG: dTMP kinase [Deltaproteobacteria bacterium]|jgi:dTMP kinase|nr:dTMP kinase [Deltaproteobacteria bacterium]
MKRGAFITLEGIEGSGKTTQARLLAETLQRRGLETLVTHEPGDTRAGQTIRTIFLDPAYALVPEAELMLVLADRSQHVSQVLKPALAAGRVVISDRFSDSTLAYQGYGRGFDLKLLGGLNRFVTLGLGPDLTVLLDCSVEVGLARTRRRHELSELAAGKEGAGGPDRFETEAAAFHSKVREGFLAIAHAEPGRVVLVDSSRDLEAVRRDVLRAVEARLAS